MKQTQHTIAVTIRDDRVPADEQQAAGMFTVTGQPYDLTDEQALALALASEHVNLEAAGGRFVRVRGALVPADHVLGITATVVAASRLDPESVAASDPAEQARRLAAEAQRALDRADAEEAHAAQLRADAERLTAKAGIARQAAEASRDLDQAALKRLTAQLDTATSAEDLQRIIAGEARS